MRRENDYTRVLRIGMVLALPIGLAVCAPEDTEWVPDELQPDPDPVSVAEPLTVNITGDDTAVTGEATLTRVGDDMMIALTLQNLPAEGPFQAQLMAGRCDAREGVSGMPGAQPETTPGAPAEPGMPGDRITDPVMQHGQVLSSLEPVRVIADQAGTSTTTVSITEMRGHDRAFIQIEGPDARPIACGDVENLAQATQGAPTGAPGTTPGTRGY